ncbi:MAG: F0F1 ATP synthase subunit delta, partial [Oscillospiraceae bacterium]|nr:F0F1 ATP synthase subunit delta [Oscillospiraceae bacterium]
LSDALKTKLKAKLESVSGKKITLVEKTDKSILGGIILDYDNVRMDSSIRNRLEGIKTSVKSIIA